MYVIIGARRKASTVGAKSEEPPSEGLTALARSEAVSWGEKQSVIAADAFRSGDARARSRRRVGERAEQDGFVEKRNAEQDGLVAKRETLVENMRRSLRTWYVA
jgi:hypothetical protein